MAATVEAFLFLSAATGRPLATDMRHIGCWLPPSLILITCRSLTPAASACARRQTCSFQGDDAIKAVESAKARLFYLRGMGSAPCATTLFGGHVALSLTSRSSYLGCRAAGGLTAGLEGLQYCPCEADIGRSCGGSLYAGASVTDSGSSTGQDDHVLMGLGRKRLATSSAIRRGRRVVASTQHQELRASAARRSPDKNCVVKDARDPRVAVAVTMAST